MNDLFSFISLPFEEDDRDLPIVNFSSREVESDAYYNIVDKFRRPVENFLESIDYECFYDDECLLNNQAIKSNYLKLVNQIQSALNREHIYIKTYKDVLLEIIEDEEILIQLDKLA